MSEARVIFRHAPIYLVTSVLNRGASLLLVVIYTRFLDPAGYGLVGTALAAAEVVGVLLSLQIAEALSRLFFDHTDERGRADVVGTAILGILGLMLLGTGPLVLAAPDIAALVAGERSAAPAVIVASLAIGFDAIFSAGLYALRAELRSSAVLVWSSGRSFALLASSGVLVGVLGYGPLGALAGMLIANLLAALGLGATLLARGGRFRWRLFRTLLGFGLPLCPAWFADAAAKFVERAVIVQRSGLAAAGLWFLALRLADVLSTLVHGPFAQVFIVRRYQLYREGAPDLASPGLFSAFFAFMAWGAVTLAALAPEAILILSGPRFAHAVPYVSAAAAAVALFSLTTLVEMRLYLAKRTLQITLAVMVSAVVHAALATIAALHFGALGVACARVAATGMRIINLALAAKGLPGPRPEWDRTLGLVVLAGGMILASVVLAAHPGWLPSATRLVLVVAFPLIVVTTPLTAPEFKSWLRRAFV